MPVSGVSRKPAATAEQMATCIGRQKGAGSAPGRGPRARPGEPGARRAPTAVGEVRPARLVDVPGMRLRCQGHPDRDRRHPDRDGRHPAGTPAHRPGIEAALRERDAKADMPS